MDDTISRQAAIKIIKNYCENGCDIAEDNWCPSCQREQFIKLLETLPSAQQCMTATSNTMMSETVKIPVMDGTTERLPTADVMDDLIKRQDAITAYCEHECGIKGMTRENCGATDCGTIFDDIPSAQQWIPCSERLPEEDIRSYAPYDEHLSLFVLVTLRGQTWPYRKNTVKLARYSYTRNEWRVANNNTGIVIAWMPLPEPYKGEES